MLYRQSLCNFVPHFIMDVITYEKMDSSWYTLVKGAMVCGASICLIWFLVLSRNPPKRIPIVCRNIADSIPVRRRNSPRFSSVSLAAYFATEGASCTLAFPSKSSISSTQMWLIRPTTSVMKLWCKQELTTWTRWLGCWTMGWITEDQNWFKFAMVPSLCHMLQWYQLISKCWHVFNLILQSMSRTSFIGIISARI